MVPESHKFACLVFRFFHPAPLLSDPVGLGHGFLARSSFPGQLANFWRNTLGTLEAEQIEGANLILIASESSSDVYVLDGANEELTARVQYLHWALVIVAGISSYEYCVLLSGGQGGDGFEVRSSGHPQQIYGTTNNFAQQVTAADLSIAATVALGIAQLHQAGVYSGPYWRMLSGFDAFLGVRSPRPHVRLHEFVRGIEAFLPPSAQGGQQFADHTRTFLVETQPAGEPGLNVVLREMYTLRNAAEHHRDLSYGLPHVPAANRVEVANRRLRQAEWSCPGFVDGARLSH